MPSYNYEIFPQNLDAELFAGFRDALLLGAKAPGGTLIDASTGRETTLKALRGKRPLVLEFGSFS